MRVRNVGPPWRRPSNEVVPRGGVFVASEREIQRMRSGKYRHLEPVDEVTPGEERDMVRRGPWPLRMAPAVYLKLHPTGPHAALARKLLGVAEVSLTMEDA